VVSQGNSLHSKHSLTLFLKAQVAISQYLLSFGAHPTRAPTKSLTSTYQ